MPLSAGTRLGPYEILAPLGSGGMGEVYRARDPRLGRDVAIKVLPAHLSGSAEIRARFEREARTVSTLNHPNICVLHDLGRAPGVDGSGDTDYLVMELLEGETLAARLTRGALPTSEVIRLGAQIADALERAHRAGVVHRDLKPGNVMITRSGAKLMDFGLARSNSGPALAGAPGSTTLPGAASAPLTQSPTVAQPLTAEGTIVGTFQYMSPEQLEGKEIDARSDLWALGCVLYEMATGRRAFEGRSQASLISAIMGSQPAPLTQLAPLSPPELERLVNQCLAKDPDDRWQSAGDVKRELEWIGMTSSQSGRRAVIGPRPARIPGWLAPGAGALVAIAALLYALGPWRDHRGAPPLVRFTIESPPGKVLDQPAEAEISPDGRSLVFTVSDSVGISHLYVRSLSNPIARELAGTDYASLPFWSPDSRTIGYFASGKLLRVSLDGSAPTVLCEAVDARGGTWSNRDVIVFAPNRQGGLFRVPANGGAATPMTQLDKSRREEGHRYPQFLPDGRHFLFVAVGSQDEVSTFAASIEGGKPVEVCRAGSIARFVPPDHLIYLDSGVNAKHRRVLARRFDPSSLRVSGDAELVLDQANATNFGYSNLSANGLGTLVVQHWSDPHSRLIWLDRHGATAGVVVDDFEATNGTLSPDGLNLGFAGSNPSDIYIRSFSATASTRVTFDNREVNNLVWSPDGRSIAYSSLSDSHGWQARVTSIDGSGHDSLVFESRSMFNTPQAWSHDGKWLVVLSTDSTGNADLWKVPMEGGRPELYQQTRGNEQNASLSPDGRWLVYSTIEEPSRAVYVQSFPTPGAKYQLMVPKALGAIWGKKGDEILVYTAQAELFAIPVSTENGFHLGAMTRLFQVPSDESLIDVEPGDHRFLTAVVKDLSASTRLEVVLNWPELLEKK